MKEYRVLIQSDGELGTGPSWFWPQLEITHDMFLSLTKNYIEIVPKKPWFGDWNQLFYQSTKYAVYFHLDSLWVHPDDAVFFKLWF